MPQYFFAKWYPLLLVSFGFNIANAQSFTELPDYAVWEIFGVFYSLDPNVSRDYFAETVVPLTSLQDGDAGAAIFSGETGAGAILWFNWLEVSGVLGTSVSAVWGPVFMRWAEGGAWDTYGWPQFSMDQLPGRDVNTLPDGRTRYIPPGDYTYFQIPGTATSQATGITYTPAAGTRLVQNDILFSWIEQGGYHRIGWATSDVRSSGNCSRRQDFSLAYVCERFGSLRWYYSDGRRLQ